MHIDKDQIHTMVDIETLGTASNSVILSIGAVRFSLADGMLAKFYSVINTQSCLLNNFTVDADTLSWWLSQEGKAKNVILAASQSKSSIHQTLRDFYGFVNTVRDCPIWANGASFDFSILSTAYKTLHMYEVPWKYYNERDYRTLNKLFPDVPWTAFEGTKHNALDDAVYQAEHLLAIFEHINNLEPKKQKELF